MSWVDASRRVNTTQQVWTVACDRCGTCFRDGDRWAYPVRMDVVSALRERDWLAVAGRGLDGDDLHYCPECTVYDPAADDLAPREVPA